MQSREHIEQSKSTQSRSRLHLALASIILLIAAFLRLWHISSIPPGPFSDESYNLVQAQEVAQGQSWPVFIAGNNGYEPMVVYLTALAIKAVGPVSWAGRLAMAWAGLIAVAAAIRCGKEMFPDRNIGILAGAVLAALFWHVDFSRFGVEPILATTAAAGSMAAFWHATRTDSRRAYIIAGVCFGLGLYTYRAFRVFLLVPMAAFIVLWIARRAVPASGRRMLLMGGVLMGSAALLTFAPLGLFFLQHPEWFIARVGQTVIPLSTDVNAVHALLSNVWITIRGLFFNGDPNWRHNFAGRPGLDDVQAAFFIVGLGAMLWKWSKPQMWTLWFWLVGGLLPAVLSIEAPHFGRMIAVTPALALVVALGMDLIWKSLPRHLGRWVVAAALCFSTTLTAWDYFGLWANRPEVFDAFEGQQSWAGRALQSAPPGAALYAASFQHPDHLTPGYTTTLALVGLKAASNLRTFYGQTCLVVPGETQTTTVYAIPDADQATRSSLEAAFPAAACSVISTVDATPDTTLCHIPPGQKARMPITTTQLVTFGDLAQMQGYALDRSSLESGGQLRLTLVWQADSISAIPYKVFVHLIGPPQADGSTVYAQQDMQPCAGSYPTWYWRPGELVIDTYVIQIPPGTAPGTYTLETGWYEDPSENGTGARLGAVDGTGWPLGDTVTLQQIQVIAP